MAFLLGSIDFTRNLKILLSYEILKKVCIVSKKKVVLDYLKNNRTINLHALYAE